MLGAQLAAAFHEGHRGAHEIHVARNRLNHQAGQLWPMQGKSRFELCQVVVLQHQRVLHHLGRHASAGWVAKSGKAGARLDQKRIGMAVITAFKFDELAASRDTAGQADGAHGGLCARTHQTHHVHAGHQAQYFLGQLNFAFRWRAVRKTFQHRLLYGLHYCGVTVAQNHRPPRADVVDIAFAVGVPKISPLCPFNESGRATHRLEGAYRGVHPAWNNLSGAIKQDIVTVSVWCHERVV